MPERKHFYEFGPFRLNPAERLLLRDGKPVPLSPKAFETLLLLVENSGHLLKKDEIMQRVWPDAFVEEVNLAHHISAIRRALDAQDDGGQYIETVPKGGYRFMAETRKVSSEAPPVLATPQGEQPARTAPGTQKQPTKRVALLTAAVLLALCVALLFVWRSRLTRASGASTVSPAQIRSIAVLPLINLSSDTQQEYFSDGMTDELITDLAKFGKLRVISHTSVQRYKETKQPLREIARELGVDAVVEGTVLRSGDRVRITAQLIDARSDGHLWANSYERDLRDILTLQNEVSQDIASKVGIRLTAAEAAGLKNSRALDPAAHEAYLKGSFFWSRSNCEGSKKALEYFQQAAAVDSNFAPAHLGLAESYFTLGDWGCWPQDKAFPKAKEAAVKAIELDPNLGSAHTWLANLASFYEWDWPDAEREYKLAIGLDPNYAVAHVFYGVFLADMGNQEESFAEMKRAQELDPTSELTNMVGVHVFYLARQYDQAIKQAKAAIELNPNSWGTFIWLGASYERKGMYNEASQAYLKSKALEGARPEELNEFQSAYEHSGIRGYWEKELARAKRNGSVCSLARVSAHLSEPKNTLDYLNQDVQLHCADLRVLNVDPIYDSLRKDPKFQDILRRMKFPG